MLPPIVTLEVLERYISNHDELESLEELGVDVKKHILYKYRRTNPKIDDIERIIEIPENDKECKIKFYAGYTITVLANFDDLCILFNDLCNGMIEFPEEEN